MTKPYDPKSTDLASEVLEAIFARPSNVVSIKSGEPVAPVHDSDHRRDFARRVDNVALEFDALYALAINNGWAEEAAGSRFLVLHGIEMQAREMKRMAGGGT